MLAENDSAKPKTSWNWTFLYVETSWLGLKYLFWLPRSWMGKGPLPLKNTKFWYHKNGCKCLQLSLRISTGVTQTLVPLWQHCQLWYQGWKRESSLLWPMLMLIVRQRPLEDAVITSVNEKIRWSHWKSKKVRVWTQENANLHNIWSQASPQILVHLPQSSNHLVKGLNLLNWRS